MDEDREKVWLLMGVAIAILVIAVIVACQVRAAISPESFGFP